MVSTSWGSGPFSDGREKRGDENSTSCVPLGIPGYAAGSGKQHQDRAFESGPVFFVRWEFAKKKLSQFGHSANSFKF